MIPPGKNLVRIKKEGGSQIPTQNMGTFFLLLGVKSYDNGPRRSEW